MICPDLPLRETSKDADIETVAEVADDLRSQSAVEVGFLPSGKLLIPLKPACLERAQRVEGRDVRVVEGARLESEACEEHGGTRTDLNAHALNELAAWKYRSV
jgi:hypothetical protein